MGPSASKGHRVALAGPVKLDVALVVFVGGCFGTALRYGAGVAFAGGPLHLGTFVANMTACFLFAAITAAISCLASVDAHRRELANRGLGMGMCGGFSTLSTLMLEAIAYLNRGDIADCVSCVLVSFAGAIAVAFVGARLGLAIGQRLQDRRVK